MPAVIYPRSVVAICVTLPHLVLVTPRVSVSHDSDQQ